MGVEDHRIVFVGGLHRSGTTLVARLLAAHPEASGFAGTGVPEDEGQHLQDVYPPASRHGGPGRFALHPAAHLTEHSPLTGPGARDRLWRAWSAHWDLSRPVLVEKSPPNLVKARFLQALFPEAAFVMVVRHPVAVAEATRKWSRRAPTALVRHWAAAHRLLLGDLPHLQRVVVVRYEDLVADPDAWLARCFALVGLAPCPAGTPVRPGVNDAYFARWRARRRNPVARARQAAAARRHATVAAAFGYDLTEPATLARPPGLPG